VDDCIKKGYIPAGTTPLEVASQQLLKDGITVIHTIGGDDTNTQAAHLSDYLKEKHDGKVIVIGMPKVGCMKKIHTDRSTVESFYARVFVVA
jgi:pyrophosphate--fructose-6-phosphate 1-phosphotransferase